MSTYGAPPIIEWMGANAPDRAAVLEDIRELATTAAPALEHVERTLTDGYACALAVETELLRLRRRLEDRAAVLGNGSGAAVREVTGLAQRVAEADEELAELRGALTGLASIAQRLRAA
jgi:uncharacterized protein involved in exopolysaccharide biosynthesis